MYKINRIEYHWTLFQVIASILYSLVLCELRILLRNGTWKSLLNLLAVSLQVCCLIVQCSNVCVYVCLEVIRDGLIR